MKMKPCFEQTLTQVPNISSYIYFKIDQYTASKILNNTTCYLIESQDLISNSPYCLPVSSCDVSLKNLVLNQLIIS